MVLTSFFHIALTSFATRDLREQFIAIVFHEDKAVSDGRVRMSTGRSAIQGVEELPADGVLLLGTAPQDVQ